MHVFYSKAKYKLLHCVPSCMTRHFLTLYEVKHLPNALNVAKQLAGYAIVESIAKLMLMKATTQIVYSVREPFQMTEYDKQTNRNNCILNWNIYNVFSEKSTLHASFNSFTFNKWFQTSYWEIVRVKKDNKLETC